VFTKNDENLEEQATLPNCFDTDLNLDPCHHDQETDCFMYAFVDNHECEFPDQPAEEQVIASIFLFDDITEIFGEPKYDEYNDDYEVEFSEQAVALSKSENDCFQQSKEIDKCAYGSSEENEESFESGERTLPLCFSSFKLLKQNVYNVSNHKSSRHDVEYEESSGLANENYLPLCFSSFELLKVNHEITKEVGKSDCIHSDIVLHEKIVISEEDQQPSHTFNDPVVDYMEGYFSSDL
jgi:hypothetical protein